MNSHFSNLLRMIPDLKSSRILDIGSGKGGFIIDSSRNGSDTYGLEISKEYISISLEEAKKQNVDIKVTQGFAEKIPFEDNLFDFLNLSEVIEHVDDPEKVLSEMYRVLRYGGKAYISVPSRFSWFDTHYHLPFLNWMPRNWSHKLIGILGKHKAYSSDNGKQRIDEMFYSTFGEFQKKIEKYNFKMEDIRELKIVNKINNKFLRKIYIFIYRSIRPFYFKTFHILLLK